MNVNCLLLYGNDTYRLKKYHEEIFLTNGISETDVEQYDYEEQGIEPAVTSAMTLPFLAEKKGVVLRNCTFLTDKKQASEAELELLRTYCSYVNPTTILVLTAPYEKLDRRKKIVKYLTKHIDSKAFNSEAKSSKNIYDYVKAEVAKNHLTIEALALTQFVNRIGNNPKIVEQELEKLITYAYHKETITSDMVYQVVTRDIDDNIYELVNAFIDRQIDRTMDVYHDLKSIKIDPIWMLGTIISKFQEILYTKELIKMNYRQEDIAKYFNASKGRTYYIMQNARNVEMSDLVQLLEQAEILDYQIKSGQVDKFLGIELFLLRQA